MAASILALGLLLSGPAHAAKEGKALKKKGAKSASGLFNPAQRSQELASA